jgi:hypothetical protein
MASAEGIVSLAADSSTESPTSDDRLMESICDSLNLERAVAKVIANDGAPGVDGMRVTQLEKYFERHRDRLTDELLSGTYRPQPVKRVEIPKPDGGVRKPGIPTAVDRVVQQAILLVLSPQWDETFSDNSFGFRPHRSAHDAVARAQSYLEDGYKWVVDRCERIVRPGVEGRLTPMMHRRVIRRTGRAGIWKSSSISHLDAPFDKPVLLGTLQSWSAFVRWSLTCRGTGSSWPWRPLLLLSSRC